MKITAVGDLILARRMHKYYEQHSIDDLLNDTLPILRSSDLNFCNLEAVISNTGHPYPKREKNPYYFRSSTRLARLLSEIQIHAATTANNHSMDYGHEGIQFQKQFLDQLGIANAGSGENIQEAMKPMYIRVGEKIVSIISFCCVKPRTLGATRKKPGIFYIDNVSDIFNSLKNVILEAKAHSDFLIISPHWTENWVTAPEPRLRYQARKLMDLGADAIFGHSSHLLMGLEIYKNKPIVYDMGTFLVDTIAGNKHLRYSAIFQLDIGSRDERKLSIYPVLLSNGGVRVADQSAFDYVTKQLTSLDNNGLDTIEWRIDGEQASITFQPEAERSKRNRDSIKSRLFDVSKIIKEPTMFDKDPDCVSRDADEYHRDFDPILLDDGYEILSYQAVECFRTGSGFLSKLIFKVGESRNQDIEIHIRGESTYGKTFDEYHPVSNGVYNALFWQKNEIVTDQVCVRVNKRVEPGKYRLYCGFVDRHSNEYIQTKDGKNLAEVSQIYVLPELVSNTSSGIDWNGKMETEVKEKFQNEFVIAPEEHLFRGIRSAFSDDTKFDKNFSLRAIEHKYGFDPSISLVYMTLFQDGLPSSRWGSRRPLLKQVLLRNIEKIKAKRNYSAFKADDSGACGILLEIVIRKQRIPIADLLNGEKLFEENDEGFEFVYDEQVDTLVTSAECRYNHLYTHRQKIVFALIKNGITDFNELDGFLVENAESISYQTVKTADLVDYQGRVDSYTKFNGIADQVYL